MRVSLTGLSSLSGNMQVERSEVLQSKGSRAGSRPQQRAERSEAGPYWRVPVVTTLEALFDVQEESIDTKGFVTINSLSRKMAW